MNSRPLPLFLNPTAGRGRAGRRLSVIERHLHDGGVAVTPQLSESVSDLERQVADAVADGETRILVAGGDGSIHEAVNGILGCDGSAALGVIPTGTGNDFAKAADIPLDWESATRLLANRIASGTPARAIDAGRMNDRFFANGAGIGFDAKVTATARAFRWPIGDLVYLIAILRAMYDGIATPSLEIRGTDFSWSGPLTLANVSNGPWVGGMFHIAPMANHADGQLELLIAGPVSRMRILRLLPSLMRGDHLGKAEITHAAVSKLSITADAPVPSHLDGEVQPMQSAFEIEVLPGALELL